MSKVTGIATIVILSLNETEKELTTSTECITLWYKIDKSNHLSYFGRYHSQLIN